MMPLLIPVNLYPNGKFKMLSVRSVYGNEKGVVLVVALVFLVVLGAMGAAAVMMTGRDLKISDVVSSPVYATGVGLVLYGMSRQDKNYFRICEKNIFFKVRDRMTEWCSEFF